jgi:hypothetical protein
MASDKEDLSKLEGTVSHHDDAKNEKDHTNMDRVDSEVAKYASEGRIEISPEDNKRLKRMVDKRVLSIMIVTYFLQALDKGTLSFSSIMGIREDTGLVAQQVSSQTLKFTDADLL